MYKNNIIQKQFSTPTQVLKSIFGYDSFRPMQLEIIQQVMAGRDTVAIMPTGGGKSLCYQIPALLLPGITIVVSPLIALMQDQVSSLQASGVNAVFLSSTLSWETYCNHVNEIQNNNVKLLYLSPEAIANKEKLQRILRTTKVSCITIDEAHCISEWGHDFRPEYRKISQIKELFPEATCLALTATATDRVRTDIIKNLNLNKPAIFIASFNRPNIFLEVATKRNPFSQVKNCLDQHIGESGIIYCFSRKQVDELAARLEEAGYDALSYHAGLPDTLREHNQNLFIRDKVKIMVATVAFGMGINKPNVRFVIHYDMPKSLEQYYQEIGRAGRDGENSHALLLYSPADIHKIKFFMDNMEDSESAEKLLQSMIKYATSHRCRRNVLLSYFGDTNPALATISKDESNKDYCCDICATIPPKMKDVTIPVQKLLSCIVRVKENFGANYVIDILLGSKQKKIIERNHDKLSTWGIGKELQKENWLDLVECLIEYGLLQRSSEYNILKLTNKSKILLKNREKIELPIDLVFNKTTEHKTTEKKEDFNEKNKIQTIKQKKYVLDATDIKGQCLLEKLKELRRQLADEENLPPYIVFQDKTLIALAVEKPQNKEALLEIHGIGTVKAERYGKSILRIISDN